MARSSSPFVWKVYQWKILWITLVPIPYRHFEYITYDSKEEAERAAYHLNKQAGADIYLTAKRKRKRQTKANRFEFIEPKGSKKKTK